MARGKYRFIASAAVVASMVKRSPIGTMTTSGWLQLGDQGHVAENIRITHVIDGRLARRLDDDARRRAEGEVHIRLHHAGGMIGAHHGDAEAALIGGAAEIHRIEVLDTLFGQIHAQFETG